MELLVAGFVLGFVMSFILFMQKVWRLEDRINGWKSRARFYKKECIKAMRENEEWTEAKCGSSDLFKEW